MSIKTEVYLFLAGRKNEMEMILSIRYDPVAFVTPTPAPVLKVVSPVSPQKIR